ncbi:anti-sigma factor domain-containing protein [Neobacillus sp. Marseille-QA0830]
MKKGIVMQIDGAFLTLLTPEGEFLRARKQKQPYEIGEEILFFPIETKTYKPSFVSRFKLNKPIWIITVAVFIIFTGSAFPVYQSNKAYAYMSIDVNPSIEIGVNKKMQVIEVTGFNKEGKKVVSRLMDWKKRDVSVVTGKIIDEIKAEGYLENKKEIVISTVVPDQSEKDLEQKLEDNVQEIKSSVAEEQLKLKVVSTTEKELEKAHELGMTAGKYQLGQSEDQKKQKKSKSDGKNQKTSISTSNPPGQMKKQAEANPQAKVPPGQMKKQAETSPPQDSGADNSQQNNAGSTEAQTSNIPPGQLKKMEEQPVKQNPGQLKKREKAASSQNSQPKKAQNNGKK